MLKLLNPEFGKVAIHFLLMRYEEHSVFQKCHYDCKMPTGGTAMSSDSNHDCSIDVLLVCTRCHNALLLFTDIATAITDIGVTTLTLLSSWHCDTGITLNQCQTTVRFYL